MRVRFMQGPRPSPSNRLSSSCVALLPSGAKRSIAPWPPGPGGAGAGPGDHARREAAGHSGACRKRSVTHARPTTWPSGPTCCACRRPRLPGTARGRGSTRSVPASSPPDARRGGSLRLAPRRTADRCNPPPRARRSSRAAPPVPARTRTRVVGPDHTNRATQCPPAGPEAVGTTENEGKRPAGGALRHFTARAPAQGRPATPPPDACGGRGP
jgi:hypothetical protein